MKTENLFSEGGNQSTKGTSGTSLDMANEDGHKDEESKKGIVHKYSLEKDDQNFLKS